MKLGIDIGSSSVKGLVLDDSGKVVAHHREPAHGSITAAVKSVVQELLPHIKGEVTIGLTGVGQDLFELPQRAKVNDMAAAALGVRELGLKVRTVLDLGSEFTKWILVGEDGDVEDFALNGLCAAGSGSFLEQQAGRLNLSVEEMGQLAAKAEKGATIAGRCSVFAKSDMIHLQQKGTPVDEIVYGLCLAQVRTFASQVLQGRDLEPPVALIGGGAMNPGLVRAVKEFYKLGDDEVLVPDLAMFVSALGAAHLSMFETRGEDVADLFSERNVRRQSKMYLPPLGPYPERPRPKEEKPPVELDGTIEAYLGVDVGSVSTNLVLLDKNLNVLHGEYLKTRGRPIEVLKEGLRSIRERFGDKLRIIGCGATGSGRYLASALLGCDVVKNEITAQLVSSAHYLPEVDTIFEIGGQDSKYIAVRNGRMLDFEMNKICAAGTGSFLEEQAQKLGISIIGEFAELAEKGDAPEDLGSQCTVFMESELVLAQKRGVSLENLTAGLAYSIARNYLERVVAHRPIGDHIVFQGGTASNAAVVAAFEKLLGKKITVHPYNRISGAIGMALMASKANISQSRFRGFELDNIPVNVVTFECKACSNRCQVSRVKIGKEIVFFGDACDLFSSKGKVQAPQRAASLGEIEGNDLVEVRDVLFKAHLPKITRGDRPKIGVPIGSINIDLAILWANLLWELGYEPVLSEPSTSTTLVEGVKGLPPESCMPLKLAAGHVRELLKKVDRVFYPSVTELPARVATEAENRVVANADQSHVCVFAQQLPLMVQRLLGKDKVLVPQFSIDPVQGGYREAWKEIAKVLGRSEEDVERAFLKALDVYKHFEEEKFEIGKKILASDFDKAVVLIGKPYNVYDMYLNMGLVHHLKKLGFLVIPFDFLPLREVNLPSMKENLVWRLSRDELRAAYYVLGDDRLYPILISNFGCGPDAFTFKHIADLLRDRVYLTLEFDELRGEAGMVTRLEAFADAIESSEEAKREAKAAGTYKAPAAFVERPKPQEVVRRYFVPWVGPHTYVFAGMLEGLWGPDVEILPPPDHASMRLGESISTGKECHPFLIVAGDVLRLIKEWDIKEGDALYYPSTVSPCLLTQYGDGYRLAIKEKGVPLQIRDYTSSEALDLFGLEGLLRMFEGLLAVDHLLIIQYRLRPYEKIKGSVDSIVDKALGDIRNELAHRRSPFNVFRRAVRQLTSVETEGVGTRPVVGVTGDLYTRLVPESNAHLFDRLEEHGLQVYPSPYFAAYIYVDSHISARKWARRGQAKPTLWELAGLVAMESRRQRYEAILPKELRPLVTEPGYDETMKLAEPYISLNSNSLVLTTVAKFVDFARRGVDGVINAIGNNCMVGIASASAMEFIKRDHGGLPMVTIMYGTEEGVAEELKLDTFIHQVHAFHRRRMEQDEARKAAE